MVTCKKGTAQVFVLLKLLRRHEEEHSCGCVTMDVFEIAKEVGELFWCIDLSVELNGFDDADLLIGNTKLLQHVRGKSKSWARDKNNPPDTCTSNPHHMRLVTPRNINK